jgi:hypothetical protein
MRYTLSAMAISAAFLWPLAFAPVQAATASGSSSLCQSLSAAPFLATDSTARLDEIVWHATKETAKVSVGPGMVVDVSTPAHCELKGSLQHRAGVNGQTYAIKFHLRLPASWNGRFFFQGGGGSDGELGDALGRLGMDGTTALDAGYAVVSQNSGHDNAVNSDLAFNGAVAFGFDPVARRNYGHTSLKLTADAAKALIREYYGKSARYSYFVGCSKGGQEGMTFAQYYPEEFDGIVASAPGFSLPRAAVTEAWDVQAFGALIPTNEGKPQFSGLSSTFSTGALSLVRKSILDACDGDDGLVDGIVGDMYRCSDEKVVAKLQAAACSDALASDCLTPSQIAALQKVVGGPHNSVGRALYTGWFWPSGIEGDGWRMWKIGSADGRVPPLNVILGGSSLAAVFLTPPVAIAGGPDALFDFQMGFDFDRDAVKIYTVAAPFQTSAWTDIGSRSSDLKAFRARGGHLIVPHGESDPVFSLKDTLTWFDEVNTLNSGHAADFVRVFPVPGMCHCGGGQATDNYDAFGALVSWVEHKRAPDSLLGTAGPNSPWPGRQRPICMYPEVARYKGAGDVNQASSFVCRT